MAKESLSLGENRSGVKTPALFLVQRPTERYNLSTVRVSFPLASSRSRSFIDAGVRDYPDVDLDQGQNWPVLVGSTAICWPLFTVKHGSRLPYLVPESTGCFPLYPFRFLSSLLFPLFVQSILSDQFWIFTSYPRLLIRIFKRKNNLKFEAGTKALYELFSIWWKVIFIAILLSGKRLKMVTVDREGTRCEEYWSGMSRNRFSIPAFNFRIFFLIVHPWIYDDWGKHVLLL